jgi:hypothetical protein
VLALPALLAGAEQDAAAIDRITLQVGQLTTAGVQASGATIALDVAPRPASSSPPALRTQVANLHLTAPSAVAAVMGNAFRDIVIDCPSALLKAPRFGCEDGTLSAKGGLLGEISVNATATYESETGALVFRGSGLKVAGATTRFNGDLRSDTWSLDVGADKLDLAAARQLLQPWFRFPDGATLTGHAQLQLQAAGHLDRNNPPGQLAATAAIDTADLNYSNQPGTAVAQDLTAALSGTVVFEHEHWQSDLQLRSPSGQLLAGTVLFDFAKNPLSLQAHLQPAGSATEHQVQVSQLRIQQTDLVDAQGDAQVALHGPTTIERAHFDVYRLDAAAAYRTFLQLELATTDFGALNVGGRAGGSVDIKQDKVSAVNAYLQNVSMADSTTRLSLANANGQLHWVAEPNGQVNPSQLSWSSSSAYGLIGGPVQLNFSTRGTDFALTGNTTRFPIFDGVLVVHSLAIRGFGAGDAELDFDAHLEPISMPLLSKAFGWPALSGQLAGTIPGVTYRDHVLAMQGDLTAHVFDGTIVGSHLKLSDPWGPWPRLDADVTARHLDLDLLTHTFSIGSISGRLDADIKGLELFNWSPVALDARLQTTPGDRSKHLISQRAVTSISSVGGGGGGVAAALQSGVLQFFKTFHYDRIGIRCQLRDEVCLMSGIEPARDGYYLVKGRGLPRIDIIGNAGRVDWTQLLSQISASTHSQNIVVR